MRSRLAIYCDCDSDSGMLTYTLMLLKALKKHNDIYALAISSAPRNEQEWARVNKLKMNASELAIVERDEDSAKEGVQNSVSPKKH